MKKISFLTAVFVLTFILSTFVSFGQTTQEEYNYLTKGYKVQMESGLDMKKGYTMTDLGTWGLNSGAQVRNCTFKGLVRQGQSKPCAILMIYKRSDIANGVTSYVCIPSINSSDDIWNQTLALVNSDYMGQAAMMETTIWALMKLSAEQAGK